MSHHLSIRNVPHDLEKAIQKEVSKRKTTKTEIVLEALRAFFNLKHSAKAPKRDIRSFFGHMSQEDFKRFKKLTEKFSEVDEEMWT